MIVETLGEAVAETTAALERATTNVGATSDVLGFLDKLHNVHATLGVIDAEVQEVMGCAGYVHALSLKLAEVLEVQKFALLALIESEGLSGY